MGLKDESGLSLEDKKAKDGSENLNINFIKSFEYFFKKAEHNPCSTMV